MTNVAARLEKYMVMPIPQSVFFGSEGGQAKNTCESVWERVRISMINNGVLLISPETPQSTHALVTPKTHPTAIPDGS